MNRILCALVLVLCCLPLSAPLLAQQPCAVLKRAPNSVHLWSGVEFQYVEGAHPQGFNFMMNLRGRHVRKLLKMGGRMAVVEPGYMLADLEGARKTCEGNMTGAPAPVPTSATPAKSQ
jgi:hypothetical protein